MALSDTNARELHHLLSNELMATQLLIEKLADQESLTEKGQDVIVALRQQLKVMFSIAKQLKACERDQPHPSVIQNHSS